MALSGTYRNRCVRFLSWLSLATLEMAGCAPHMPVFENVAAAPADSLSGLVEVRADRLRHRMEAAAAIQAPDRLRFEVLSGAGTEAILVLKGGEAWCAFPRDRQVYVSTASEITTDLLGLDLASEELYWILVGRSEGLDRWVRSGDSLVRGSVKLTYHRVYSAARFPWSLEISGQGHRLSVVWKQVLFDSRPAASAFDCPAGYAACERAGYLERLGLRD